MAPADKFATIDEALELLGRELGPKDAHARIRQAVSADQVLLRHGADLVRFSETTVHQDEASRRAERQRAAREAARNAPRYNPVRREAPRAEAFRQPPARDLLAELASEGYALSLRDLETMLARDGLQLDLRATFANQAADTEAGDGTIDRLLQIFRTDGRKPECEKLSQPLWKSLVSEAGISFADTQWNAAWAIAVERDYVVRLAGAPTLANRIKHVRRAKNLSAAPQFSTILLIARESLRISAVRNPISGTTSLRTKPSAHFGWSPSTRRRVWPCSRPPWRHWPGSGQEMRWKA